MPIIKHDPFKDIERFFEDDFFGFVPAVRRHLDPPMDVYQTDGDLVVELQVPKIDPTKIHVSVEDGILKIESGHTEEEEEEDKNYFRKEIRRGGFIRMLSLPVPVKESETEAVYENGVLKITIPKTEVKQAKKVEVKVK